MTRRSSQSPNAPLSGSTDSSKTELPDQALPFMTRWVAALADQVLNPVASITAAVDIVEQELARYETSGTCGTETIRTALAMMRGRLATLDHYVSELADFGKSLALEPRLVDLVPVVDELIQSLEGARKYHGTITNRLGAEFKVFCDPVGVRNMLRALVLNGLESVPVERNPIIDVVGEHRVGPNGQSEHVLAIVDNGSGISEKAWEEIVKPFVSTKEAGSGLGLALVAKYADAQGIRVKACAAEPFGTRIELQFPSTIDR